MKKTEQRMEESKKTVERCGAKQGSESVAIYRAVKTTLNARPRAVEKKEERGKRKTVRESKRKELTKETTL